jgi:methylated-DNA-protein-cysteine methyltransferase-like protein
MRENTVSNRHRKTNRVVAKRRPGAKAKPKPRPKPKAKTTTRALTKQRTVAKRAQTQSPPVKADIRERILAAIRRIPRSRVCTYGNVADVAGLPRRARLVGTVLRQTPASRDLPWYRVINAGGRISFPSASDAYRRQRSKLEAEGVVFIGGRVDLQRHGWPDRDVQLDELLWGVP